MANHGGSYELRDGKRVLKARTKIGSDSKPAPAHAEQKPASDGNAAPAPTPPPAVDKPSKLKEPHNG